jgi:dATP pyrophosphohydrolase
MVHGSIETGEAPHDAAMREVREETGLTPDRLYNVTAHAFYLHKRATVEVAVVFCAFVRGTPRPQLGAEHSRAEWVTRAEARRRFVWPMGREVLERAYALLRRGHAGAVEDVLRVY